MSPNSRASVEVKLEGSEHKTLMHYFPKGIVAFDLETTGLSPLLDKIIEISAIKITDKIETFHSLIDPKIPIPDITSKIHGLYDEDVKGAPELLGVIEKFLEFSEGLPLLAHNAQFDAGFLINSLEELELDFPKIDIFCSVKFARKIFKKLESYNLGELTKALNIPLNSHHQAMDDTYGCLKIFLKGLEHENMNKKVLKDAFLFSLKDFRHISYDPNEPVHKALVDAIKAQSTVQIMYKGGSHKGDWRSIRPLSILPLPQGPAVYAHCLISDLYKFFYLKKITDIKEK